MGQASKRLRDRTQLETDIILVLEFIALPPSDALMLLVIIDIISGDSMRARLDNTHFGGEI